MGEGGATMSDKIRARAVIFDLDDTLFAWSPCDTAACHAVHLRLAASYALTRERFDELYDQARAMLKERMPTQAARHNRVLFFQHIVQQVCGSPRPSLVSEVDDLYWKVFLDAAEPNRAAHAVLEEASRQVPIAMLSNHTAGPQLKKLRALKMDPYFHCVMTSEEAGVEKPDPAIFQQVLRRLGVAAADAVMVGNHPTLDILGAHKVGMATVHSREYDTRTAPEGAADAVIHKLSELWDVLTLEPS